MDYKQYAYMYIVSNGLLPYCLLGSSLTGGNRQGNSSCRGQIVLDTRHALYYRCDTYNDIGQETRCMIEDIT